MTISMPVVSDLLVMLTTIHIYNELLHAVRKMALLAG